MLKRDELSDPNSCLNRAKDDEMVFVLIGRDVSAPAAIRSWIADRIARGKNKPDDAQILDAEKCIRRMILESSFIPESPEVDEPEEPTGNDGYEPFSGQSS